MGSEFLKMWFLIMVGQKIKSHCLLLNYNVGIDPHWYAVQVSDTTMLENASKPGQKIIC